LHLLSGIKKTAPSALFTGIPANGRRRYEKYIIVLIKQIVTEGK
jgi:hypothetical protein